MELKGGFLCGAIRDTVAAKPPGCSAAGTRLQTRHPKHYWIDFGAPATGCVDNPDGPGVDLGTRGRTYADTKSHIG